MQFIVIGRDGTDDKALERRLSTRPAHIALGEELRRNGNMWYGVALWDDNERMVGSMLLMNFPSEKELQAWLKKEPYVTAKVWQTVEIQPCHVRAPWQFNQSQEWFERHGYTPEK